MKIYRGKEHEGELCRNGEYRITGIGALFSTTAPIQRAVSIAAARGPTPGRERAGGARVRIEIERDDEGLDDLITMLTCLRNARDAEAKAVADKTTAVDPGGPGEERIGIDSDGEYTTNGKRW